MRFEGSHFSSGQKNTLKHIGASAAVNAALT
jgi:hypothetical protein